jgi:hypothetical protein
MKQLRSGPAVEEEPLSLSPLQRLLYLKQFEASWRNYRTKGWEVDRFYDGTSRRHDAVFEEERLSSFSNALAGMLYQCSSTVSYVIDVYCCIASVCVPA